MEDRYFLVPDALERTDLPEEEAQHAYKVLRLNERDEIVLIDGKGCFHRAQLTLVSKKLCTYVIKETTHQDKGWDGSIHLAIAPTKNFDRMEWMAEKCTEIGFDSLSFLDCQNSERHRVRMERIERVVASAVKQSRKPYMPVLRDIVDFNHFIVQPYGGKKFICHCNEDIERAELLEEMDALPPGEEATIIVGPEGDFSTEEVWRATNNGFKSVSLGTFRLRTETAGVMAVSMFNLVNRIKKTQ